MESKHELKEIDFENRACYYFDDIITDIYFDDILSDKRIYKNISVYATLHKTSMGPKPLRIRFDKIDGFIRTRGDKFIKVIKVRKLILQVVYYNFREIRIDS